MKPYSKYKPTNIPWIGDIPKDWKTKKIKHTAYVKARVGWKGLTSSEFLTKGYAYLVTGVDFHDGKIKWKECYQINRERYEDDPFIQLKDEDLLITKDGTIGKLAVVSDLDKPACLNSGIFVIRSLHTDLSTRFLYWVLFSEKFKQFNEYTSYGSTIQHLYQNVFVEFSYCYPSPKEQTTIAQFLDKKTTEIDNLISQKQKLIALLEEEKKVIINQAVTKGINPKAKMKKSGIEWIGEIPKDWEIKKIKFLSKLISKGTTPSTIGRDILPNGEVLFIKAENILSTNMLSNYPVNYIDRNTNEMLKRSQIEENDVLIVIAGATIGKVAIVTKEFIPANTNQAVCFIRLNNLDFSKWLWYVLQSDYIKKIIELDSVQAAQPNLSMEKIGGFPVVIPSEKKLMKEVLNVLEVSLKKIDDAISRIKLEIELINEYKISLISEAVTGKIDIRNYKIK